MVTPKLQDDTMTKQILIDELLSALTLTQTAPDEFEAPSFDFAWAGRLFGGQVLAQALMAGALTLKTDKPCHSLHGYFLAEGDVRRPVVYQVRHLRDGRSLSARQIIALQRTDTKDGRTEKVIFSMMASFSLMEGGFDYQPIMPTYPNPHLIKDEQALKTSYLDDIPREYHERFMKERHVQIRPMRPRHPLTPTPDEPHQANWLRANISHQPFIIHQALLAFMSDYHLMGSGLIPHGLSYATKGLQVASIDHSMHFHRPFDVSQWLLYDMWSSTTSHAKGLNHGQLWQDGNLVATTQQEGLMRLVKPV